VGIYRQFGEHTKIVDARNRRMKHSSLANSWNPQFVAASGANRAGSTGLSQTEITGQLH